MWAGCFYPKMCAPDKVHPAWVSSKQQTHKTQIIACPSCLYVCMCVCICVCVCVCVMNYEFCFTNQGRGVLAKSCSHLPTTSSLTSPPSTRWLSRWHCLVSWLPSYPRPLLDTAGSAVAGQTDQLVLAELEVMKQLQSHKHICNLLAHCTLGELPGRVWKLMHMKGGGAQLTSVLLNTECVAMCSNIYLWHTWTNHTLPYKCQLNSSFLY